MCGRFARTRRVEILQKFFGVQSPMFEMAPSYNIAPTQLVLVIREAESGREAVSLKWGLVPAWAKDPNVGIRAINGRAETLLEKATFKTAFRKRRCLVLADGFFEWRKEGKGKTPYYFSLREDSPFAFAGLWESWRSPEGQKVESCTIITTTANELVQSVHDRMPVVLPQRHYALWLDPGFVKAEELVDLLLPYPSEEMQSWVVGAGVGNVRNNSPECVVPVSSI